MEQQGKESRHEQDRWQRAECKGKQEVIAKYGCHVVRPSQVSKNELGALMGVSNEDADDLPHSIEQPIERILSSIPNKPSLKDGQRQEDLQDNASNDGLPLDRPQVRREHRHGPKENQNASGRLHPHPQGEAQQITEQTDDGDPRPDGDSPRNGSSIESGGGSRRSAHGRLCIEDGNRLSAKQTS